MHEKLLLLLFHTWYKDLYYVYQYNEGVRRTPRKREKSILQACANFCLCGGLLCVCVYAYAPQAGKAFGANQTPPRHC